MDASPPLHALVIGIDRYWPRRAGGGSYPDLGGAVRDAEAVEAWLRTRLGVPDERIIKLTASIPDNAEGEPPDPPERLPTYENIVAAFQRIAATAQAGDRVHVHYSGHGGRCETRYPALKGRYGRDEALVPTDIGRDGARYLTDVELALLLDDLARRQLSVSVVLDSCHSGGMARGTGPCEPVARGTGRIDTTPRPADSDVAPREELEALWHRLTAGGRAGMAGSRWLPEAEGYVLLAACRPSESARERCFEGVPSGVLTHWLLRTLDELEPGASWRDLHRRLLARVHDEHECQAPMLQGEADRVVFGPGETSLDAGAIVYREEAGRVLIGAGEAQGVALESRVEIYPSGTRRFNRARPIATALVDEVGATFSWARLQGSPPPIPAGAPVKISAPGAIQLVRHVRLDESAPGGHPEAMRWVAGQLDDNAWLEPADDDAEADWTVRIGGSGEFEVLDDRGEPVPNLQPPLRAGVPGEAGRLVRRLAHLARYRAIRELRNDAPGTEKLEGKLDVRIGRVQPGANALEPLADGNPVFAGETVWLRVTNRKESPLNVAVVRLRADWSVKQEFPRGADFEPLGWREERDLPLHVTLAAGLDRGDEVVKVFATLDTPNFRLLELPALGGAISHAVRGDRAGGPLDRLLAALAAERPGVRALQVTPHASRYWTVVEITLTVVRRPGTSSRRGG